MNNDRLPIDILEDIFLFYQVHEDVFYPLETLLLVCKFWSIAALDCHPLWSKFNIIISHEPIMTTEVTRLPLRLARTGVSALLDISIVVKTGPVLLPLSDHRRKLFSPLCLKDSNVSNSTDCHCLWRREQSVASALELLAGEEGELCKRWRSLALKLEGMNFCINPQYSGTATQLRGLTYPTPALKTLTLCAVKIWGVISDSNLRMLPLTSSLEELENYHSVVAWQSAIPNLRKVTIHQATPTRYVTTQRTSLEGSKLIGHLHVDIGRDWNVTLPPELPHLTRLILHGNCEPLGLEECRMPQLQYLEVCIGECEVTGSLVDYPDFPFGQIRTLAFRLEARCRSYGLEELRDSMLKILRLVATSLISLHSVDIIHSIVLKWLWESKHPSESDGAPGDKTDLFFYQKVTLSTANSSRELSGHESCEELELLANEWDILSPSLGWESLLSELLRVSTSLMSQGADVRCGLGHHAEGTPSVSCSVVSTTSVVRALNYTLCLRKTPIGSSRKENVYARAEADHIRSNKRYSGGDSAAEKYYGKEISEKSSRRRKMYQGVETNSVISNMRNEPVCSHDWGQNESGMSWISQSHALLRNGGTYGWSGGPLLAARKLALTFEYRYNYGGAIVGQKSRVVDEIAIEPMDTAEQAKYPKDER